MAIWKKAKDNLMNGAILGGVLGAAIVWSDKVIEFVEDTIPTNWLVLGSTWSIPVYIIGGLALIGYLLDRY